MMPSELSGWFKSVSKEDCVYRWKTKPNPKKSKGKLLRHATTIGSLSPPAVPLAGVYAGSVRRLAISGTPLNGRIGSENRDDRLQSEGPGSSH